MNLMYGDMNGNTTGLPGEPSAALSGDKVLKFYLYYSISESYNFNLRQLVFGGYSLYYFLKMIK